MFLFIDGRCEMRPLKRAHVHLEWNFPSFTFSCDRWMASHSRDPKDKGRSDTKEGDCHPSLPLSGSGTANRRCLHPHRWLIIIRNCGRAEDSASCVNLINRALDHLDPRSAGNAGKFSTFYSRSSELRIANKISE